MAGYGRLRCQWVKYKTKIKFEVVVFIGRGGKLNEKNTNCFICLITRKKTVRLVLPAGML